LVFSEGDKLPAIARSKPGYKKYKTQIFAYKNLLLSYKQCSSMHAADA